MTTPIVNALTIAAQALDQALAPLVPTFQGRPARWCLEQAPHLTGALLGGDLAKCIIAQSQDRGGAGVDYFDAQDWSGLITIKCSSATRTTAETLRDAVPAALATLAVTGYSIHAVHVRPLDDLPLAGGIYTVASIYRLTIAKE